MDELRRDYHDRIVDLRDRSQALLGAAVSALERAVSGDPNASAGDLVDLGAVGAEVLVLETGVLDVIALQAPVARDLRVILASLFVAQTAELCLGLDRALLDRKDAADDALTPDLRELASEIAQSTVELLRDAGRAWAGLDAELAQRVFDDAETSRRLQRRLLGALVDLPARPVEAAVDLGMTARAYERLTDHAVEVAARVIFAATGVPVDPAVLARR